MLQAERVYFTVTEPVGPETPLVVEVPHAGLTLDAESLAYCIAPARSIGRDADLLVDRLFAQAPSTGATLLVAHTSRYVCDLNRSELDLDSHTAETGTASSAPHGVIWRRTTSGRPALAIPLPASEVERRLSTFYRPYHARLEELLAEKERRFGYSILLCAHSMPSFGRLGERRADIVPGSRGGTTTGARHLSLIDAVAGRFQFDVRHDDPYRGGFTTGHHGRPADGREAVQVELARRIYMNENSLTPKDGAFARTQEFCRTLVSELGANSR